MVLPRPAIEAGEVGLRALLAHPSRALLAFDFDGTLAPIVDDPSQARAHPGVVPALRRLAPHVAGVAVVTGRPAAVAVELGRFAGEPDLAGLVVAGHYGLERWDATTGRVIAPDPHPGVASVRSVLPGLLADAPVGTTTEDKGHSVAVHVRTTADPQDVFERLREPLAALAESVGLVLEPGRLVLELRPPGVDKGAALRALVTEVDASCVVFAGDDLGDLPAYDAVERLRSDGGAGNVAGLLICAGSTEVGALAERADLVVDGPEGVVGLLETLADRLA